MTWSVTGANAVQFSNEFATGGKAAMRGNGGNAGVAGSSETAAMAAILVRVVLVEMP